MDSDEELIKQLCSLELKEPRVLTRTSLRLIACCIFWSLISGCGTPTPLPQGVKLIEIDSGYFENPIWSPDGSKIIGGRVLLAMPDFPNFGFLGTEIYLIDVSTGRLERIFKEENSHFRPFGWTEEGNSVIVDSENSSFGHGCFIFNLQTLTPNLSPEELCRYGLSPDKRKYAHFEYQYPYEELVLIISDARSGKSEVVYSISTKGVRYPDHSMPEWSPDGKKIVFDLGLQTERDKPKDTDIHLFDIKTRTLEKWLEDPKYFDHSPVFSPDGRFIAHYAMRFTENAQIDRSVVITRFDKSCQWRLPFGGSFDWSPDSTKLVISTDDGVYIIDLPQYLGESFTNETGCP